MGFHPLIWYCKPESNEVWASVVDGSFGSYTPCAVDSLVNSISHLVLLGLCLYRIWLIKWNFKAKRFRLRSNVYNYMLGILAGYCTAEPLLRLVMDISIFNLGGQTGLAPFEVGSLSYCLYSLCCLMVSICLVEMALCLSNETIKNLIRNAVIIVSFKLLSEVQMSRRINLIGSPISTVVILLLLYY